MYCKFCTIGFIIIIVSIVGMVGLVVAQDSMENNDPDCNEMREREDNSSCHKVKYTIACWYIWGQCSHYYWDD